MEFRCQLFQRRHIFGLLLLLVFLVGCSTSTAPTTVSSTALPTVTPLASAAQSPPTTTHTPTPSSVPPTVTASPTFTPPPPTLTPAPTLAADERQALVREMLKTNGGCELPCWWGITPGQTDWQAVLRQCESYGDCDFDVPESAQTPDYIIRQHFDQQDKKVRSIKITSEVPGGRMLETFSRDWRRYALNQVLARYGKPSQVLLELSNYCADPPCGSSGYGLYIAYNNLGVLIRYLGLAERSDPIRVCPVFAKVSYLQLVLQSPQDPRPLIETAAIDPDQLKQIRPLTETTGMTVENFYETFKDPNSKMCITSPAKFWQ